MPSPHRRLLVVGAAAVAAAGAATTGFVLIAPRPHRPVVVTAPGAGDPTPTTTATTAVAPTTGTTQTTSHRPGTTAPAKRSSPTTTRLAAAATTTAQPPPTTGVPATAGEPTTTTTAMVCRDSVEVACGPFRWDPPPDNGPLTVNVTVLTPHPTAGQPVQIRVVLDDSDARIETECFTRQYFGDDSTDGTCTADPPPCPEPQRYGPWTPPAKQPDHRELLLTHTYRAGTYTATFAYSSTGRLCAAPYPDPYGSSGTGSITFGVAAPFALTIPGLSPTGE